MCDYSLQSVKTRKAAVDDKLTTKNFGTGTVGFCSADAPDTAVCVLPGTEIAFSGPIKARRGIAMYMVPDCQVRDTGQTVGIFRQIEKENRHTHHDALELPGGETILLTQLVEGQEARVLQVPVNAEERMPYNEGYRSLEVAAGINDIPAGYDIPATVG